MTTDVRRNKRKSNQILNTKSSFNSENSQYINIK